MATEPQALGKRAGGSVDETGSNQSSTEEVRPRPNGLLPRGRALREAKSDDLEFALDVAEGYFPEEEHLSDLRPQVQFAWIPYATALLRGQTIPRNVIEALAELLEPGLAAEVKDFEERQEFDFALKREEADKKEQSRALRESRKAEKHQQDIADQEQNREIEKERFAGEEEERKNKEAREKAEWKLRKTVGKKLLKNRSRRENAVLVMSVVAFALAVVVCIIGLTSKDHLLAGGSGGTAIAILGVALGRLWLEHRQGVASPEKLLQEVEAQADG